MLGMQLRESRMIPDLGNRDRINKDQKQLVSEKIVSKETKVV